jgi:hypothetical protein
MAELTEEDMTEARFVAAHISGFMATMDAIMEEHGTCDVQCVLVALNSVAAYLLAGIPPQHRQELVDHIHKHLDRTIDRYIERGGSTAPIEVIDRSTLN